MSNRLSPDLAKVVMEALEFAEEGKGFSLLNDKDCENLVVKFFLMGFWFRGHCPDIEAIRYYKKGTETKSFLGNLSEESTNRIYRYLLSLAEDTSKKDITRCIALLVLGAQKRKSVLKVIEKIVKDEDKKLTLIIAAAKCASSLGDPTAAQLFFPIIKEMNQHTPQTLTIKKNLLSLLENLYPLKIAFAEPTLFNLLKSKDLFMRIAAIMLLPVLEEKVALDKIKQYINNKNWRIRYAAIKACRKIGTADAVDLLIQHMDNESGRLKFDVLVALQKLTGIEMPYRIADWRKWWDVNRKSYSPSKEEKKTSSGRTFIHFPDNPSYFGLKVISKRVCLVLDISSSMSTPFFYHGINRSRLNVMKEELSRLLHTFQRKTYFNLIFFSTDYTKAFKHLVPMNTHNYKKALDLVNRVKTEAETNIYDPLEEALLDPYVNTIYLLSDGYPTCGKHSKTEDILRAVRKLNRLRGIQINTISIARDSELMHKLVDQNSGIYRLYRSTGLKK